ncbi:CaiB/BaiF CoA-transferase family protein [Viridibacillus sp. FSL R5-0477]|uniref:Alpha-methylacyl-CoA racemase n=1 Tax=Viridibacillus arenosi FSL R5-213 TaxID=1227360 RepID=W4EQX8_9BACL|nr:CaiB/BaiF CoA-transferase family protein [Viridibacillus arenosi]ETT82669.1 alpha-methylacyl-CoA racemase [Viridibacillus arenosi FSL R5-213]OMC92256.1 CoA transferase [Viridibacillus arenosi]
MGILNGLKILDFSTLLPGPYATMMLADLGAEVIRVESSTRVDLIRVTPPFDKDDLSAAHGYLNRSKRSLTLNLKQAASVEIIKTLVAEYDIVIEQFRPGVMERLGLDYESLKKVNSKLIYCSLTGYGQTGPYRNRPGHDNNYLSVAGVMDYSRRKGKVPTTMGIQIADIAGGSLHSVIGILAAVVHREKTGEGQYIDVSMTDAAFSMNAVYGSGYLVGGIEPQPEEMQLNGGTFYDFYETKDGRYFSVGSIEPPFKKILCEALGKSELFELGMSEQAEDQGMFKKEIKAVFLTKNYEEWLTVFDEDLEACVEPVLTFAEACDHPQLQARGMIVDVPKADGSSQKQMATPIKFSSAKPIYQHVGTAVGENTAEILEGQGFSEHQIREWKEQGVFK